MANKQYRKRQYQRNAKTNNALALLKFLVLLSIITCGIALLVYPNQDVLAEVWKTYFQKAPIQTGQVEKAAIPQQPAAVITTEDTIVTKIVPVERGIQAEVLNGCGVRGLADKATHYLRKNNIDVVNTDNYDTFDVLTTRILDRSDNPQKAREVAKLLGIPENRILLRKDSSLKLDVTIILGADYKKLKFSQK
jgi:hypothetical protein